MNTQDDNAHLTRARDILTELVKQIQITMIQDESPMTARGMAEFIAQLATANELLAQNLDHHG